MAPPSNIHSIAIEGIYDTSREAIPHEILWSAISEQFGRNGRLMVVSPEEADALVRVHIKKAQVVATGSPTIESIRNDPDVTADNKFTPPEFKNLQIAGSYTKEESLKFTCFIEVYDLHTRKVIFKKDYNAAGTFSSITGNSVTRKEGYFLFYEESLQGRMKAMSEQLARSFVTDFFLTR